MPGVIRPGWHLTRCPLYLLSVLGQQATSESAFPKCLQSWQLCCWAQRRYCAIHSCPPPRPLGCKELRMSTGIICQVIPVSSSFRVFSSGFCLGNGVPDLSALRVRALSPPPQGSDSAPFSGTQQNACSHSFYSTSPVSPSPCNILLVSGVCTEIYLGCFVPISLFCTLGTLRFPKGWPLGTHKAETPSLSLPLAATALPKTVSTEWPCCLHEGKGKTAGVGVFCFTCAISPPLPFPPNSLPRPEHHTSS